MRIENVSYTPFSLFMLNEQVTDVTRFLQLASEFGEHVRGGEIFARFQQATDAAISDFSTLVNNAKSVDEPDSLEAIRSKRPAGPRRLSDALRHDYVDRLRGAFYGRMAGCTLGAMLEFQSVDAMKNWAEHFGDPWPPTDYWRHPMQNPLAPHYVVGRKVDLTRGNIRAVPPDDDIMYTLLGLILLETYGPDFTYEHFADVYTKYLPLGPDDSLPGERGCWWGERRLIQNLNRGVEVKKAGFLNNANLQSIAAWTRADPYGYVFPGWPEKAAELAFKDASINHRRNGVYGSMFMAATISAAFIVDTAEEAIRIGLTEIPQDCLLSDGINWALEQTFENYKDAYALVWNRYAGMFNGSAITNAIQVVMGLILGQSDFTRIIGETIAMGGDNDCTGATSGSIAGALLGFGSIPNHWIQPFEGKLHSYLKEHDEYLSIEVLCSRFVSLANTYRELS